MKYPLVYKFTLLAKVYHTSGTDLLILLQMNYNCAGVPFIYLLLMVISSLINYIGVETTCHLKRPFQVGVGESWLRLLPKLCTLHF